MSYDLNHLPLQRLLPALARAEDQLARLDEIVGRSPVKDGFIERGHFFDAAAAMWVAGKLVHVEDLVLHDAYMDVRAPSHELTISYTILRLRRRIANSDPVWAFSRAGISVLTGETEEEFEKQLGEEPPISSEGERGEHDDPFALEMADIDRIIARSQHTIDRLTEGRERDDAENSPFAVGELVIRDSGQEVEERLSAWLSERQRVADLPASLAAALLWDAWGNLEPLHRQDWLGSQLIAAYLRSRGKVTSHLLSFNVGLKVIPRERRRSQSRTTRLLAALDALSETAAAGIKEIARLKQAQNQLERRLKGKRSSSSLPGTMQLFMSRPVVSAGMIAKEIKVTQRGALNLISELGVREMTGRGRYRAWGIL